MFPLFSLLLWSLACLSAWSLPASASNRLLLLPSEKHFAQADQRLAREIHSDLLDSPRFHVLPVPAHGGMSRGAELAKAAGATDILLIEFLETPEPQYFRLTDVKAEFRSHSLVDVRLLDPESMQPRSRQVFLGLGVHEYAKNVAEDEAFKQLRKAIIEALRSAFPLETRLKSRQGNMAEVEGGRDQGLQSGMLFARKTSQGPEGLLEISSVATDSAKGTIFQGTWQFQPGDALIEQVYGSVPAAVGLSRYQLLNSSVTGVSLERNHSGIGWGGRLEVAAYQQENASGPALIATLVRQSELVPERLWTNLDLGVGATLLSTELGSGRATNFGLHGLLGMEMVAKALPSMSAALGLFYLTPWPINFSSSSTLDLGGLGLRFALNWQI